MYVGRSHIERGGGLHTRENAGISSERVARNHSVESLRFPGEGSSAQRSNFLEEISSLSHCTVVLYFVASFI